MELVVWCLFSHGRTSIGLRDKTGETEAVAAVEKSGGSARRMDTDGADAVGIGARARPFVEHKGGGQALHRCGIAKCVLDHLKLAPEKHTFQLCAGAGIERHDKKLRAPAFVKARDGNRRRGGSGGVFHKGRDLVAGLKGTRHEDERGKPLLGRGQRLSPRAAFGIKCGPSRSLDGWGQGIDGVCREAGREHGVREHVLCRRRNAEGAKNPHQSRKPSHRATTV